MFVQYFAGTSEKKLFVSVLKKSGMIVFFLEMNVLGYRRLCDV